MTTSHGDIFFAYMLLMKDTIKETEREPVLHSGDEEYFRGNREGTCHSKRDEGHYQGNGEGTCPS